MKKPFLELENISKTFPGIKALHNVKFNIYPGEVHSLVGENGAGKSTLIKVMSGAHQPDEGGSIKIERTPVKIANPIDAIKKGISVIYQDFSLFGNLTVAENIVINQIIEKNKLLLNWKEIREKAEDALKIVGADINTNEILDNLSIAKKQIVAIAGAIAQNAKMIIMDEPTSALSKKEVENLYKIIDMLKEKNIAVMFVSHKMDELFKVSDRFTILRDGQYVDTVKSDNIDRKSLISKMVGRDVSILNYANLNIKENPVMEIKNLSKKGNYKNINLKLHKGEVLGITGLVGAGRSELFQTIFGIIKPDSGEIIVEGENLLPISPWKAVTKGIGYIPESRQTEGLILEKMISDNITLPLLKNFTNKFGLINIEKQSSLVKDLINRLDVRPKNESLKASQLSGGNQQKVVIAKWVATNPKILIVDEPTNGVDIGAKADIHRILRELAEKGTSIIVISSELPEIMSISDRILVMRKGTISGEFKNSNLTQEMIMEKAVINK
ncbi:MAG: sugar ABC transporter ATP-binding protein [Leptotrichiaceae bacterium]|nr:sugar ABC transporter ATP-binding protein [Leptotrichiaceae bacterium]